MKPEEVVDCVRKLAMVKVRLVPERISYFAAQQGSG